MTSSYQATSRDARSQET
jgi:hypothetical protein